MKKSDIANYFSTLAIDGILDLSAKSNFIIIFTFLDYSDMHSNELAKAIKTNSAHIR